MSHDRPASGLLVFICDACSETFEVTDRDEDLGDYNACWRLAKDDGWRFKSGEHLCPECADLS